MKDTLAHENDSTSLHAPPTAELAGGAQPSLKLKAHFSFAFGLAGRGLSPPATLALGVKVSVRRRSAYCIIDSLYDSIIYTGWHLSGFNVSA
jgi:hypothetical protein